MKLTRSCPTPDECSVVLDLRADNERLERLLNAKTTPGYELLAGEIERLRAYGVEAAQFSAVKLHGAEREIERLRAALRPFAMKHRIGAGYGPEDFARASEVLGNEQQAQK